MNNITHINMITKMNSIAYVTNIKTIRKIDCSNDENNVLYSCYFELIKQFVVISLIKQ